MKPQDIDAGIERLSDNAKAEREKHEIHEAEMRAYQELCAAREARGKELSRQYDAKAAEFRWFFTAVGVEEGGAETPAIALGRRLDNELGEVDLYATVKAIRGVQDVEWEEVSFQDGRHFETEVWYSAGDTKNRVGREYFTSSQRLYRSAPNLRSEGEWADRQEYDIDQSESSLEALVGMADDTLAMLVEAASDPVRNPAIASRVRTHYQPVQPLHPSQPEVK